MDTTKCLACYCQLPKQSLDKCLAYCPSCTKNTHTLKQCESYGCQNKVNMMIKYCLNCKLIIE